MEDEKAVICRLCLSFSTIDECQALDTVSEDILKDIVPEVDLNISQDPKLCQTCYKTMLRCYRFKSNCKKGDKTDTEKKPNTMEVETISVHTEEIEKRCVFCCNNIDDESIEDFSARKTYFNEVLQKCLPEWNLSRSTVPCKICLETLTDQYTFIGNCSDTEDKLKHYCVSQGMNSKGKLNLYEALQHILSRENVESGSMTQTEEEMPRDNLSERVKEEIAFPELDAKAENITIEAIDIKSEALHEELLENIETFTYEISEQGASGFTKQPGGSKCKHIIDDPYKSPPKKKGRTGIFEVNDKDVSATNICRDFLREHKFGPFKRYHKRLPLLDKVSNEDRNRIRRIVHSFFRRHEQPTLEKIQSALNEEECLPHLSNTILTRVLNEVHFRFKGKTQNKFIKEKDETVIWRRRYLSQIKKYRNEGRPIYYLDETSIEIGQNAVMYPTENNSFTVLHIGGDEGFVKSILLFLKAKRNDSNEEIRKTLFEEWFAKTLSKLKDGAVIVLHQSSCHSRPLEEFPTTSTPKVDIQKWLSTKGVPFEDDMVRTELLALVKRMKPSAKRYLVDEMAKAENKSVLRLPPYHSELNPLRSIWGRIKDDVEAKRPRNKLKDFRSLVVDAVARVSVEDWRKAITDVEKVEEEMWQLDIDMEQQIEPLLVNCSSTESETESE